MKAYQLLTIFLYFIVQPAWALTEIIPDRRLGVHPMRIFVVPFYITTEWGSCWIDYLFACQQFVESIFQIICGISYCYLGDCQASMLLSLL